MKSQGAMITRVCHACRRSLCIHRYCGVSYWPLIHQVMVGNIQRHHNQVGNMMKIEPFGVSAVGPSLGGGRSWRQG